MVGLWTIRLLVQVHRHWVQLTLVRRGYVNHNCHNKLQIGNGLECKWCHSRKRWTENLEILKKTAVGSWLWASRVGSLLGTSSVGCRMGTGRVGNRLGPCRRTVEVEFPTMVLRSLGFDRWSIRLSFSSPDRRRWKLKLLETCRAFEFC